MKRFVLTVALVAMLFGCLAGTAEAQKNAWGGLYVTGGSTAQALATGAAKMTGFTTAQESSTDDGDQSIVADAANDNIALVPGVYLITLNCTATMGTADVEVTYALYNGTTAITGAQCQFEAEATGMPTNTSLSWLYRPTAAATLNVYVSAETGTPNLTPTDCQLTVVRLQ